ncbi:hypothetical protein LYZ37_23565 (plasmid) [Vibrio tubiashii]|uniref:hypothetical protein n=1 Tax=Vibrio oreintalis group TaxID=1891919 RepID=UPI001EFEDC87|nr:MULTISPECIES: hypothetical protein [Vibrio oreintalis group]MCG9753257.1 hypothetical protein [Vibrio brasiliensis]WCP70409.1 hypothetical protein LYZ37_23565 [Vibrio tubiashii]
MPDLNRDMGREVRLLCVIDKQTCFMDHNGEDASVNEVTLEALPQTGTSFIGICIGESQYGSSLWSVDVTSAHMDQVLSSTGNPYIRNSLPKLRNGEFYAVLITVKYNDQSDSYLYRTYSEDAPRRADVLRMAFLEFGCEKTQRYERLYQERLHGQPERAKRQKVRDHQGQFVLVPYSVGQGMCSLLHNGSVGYLLDAGAGTPIKRPDYIGKKFSNQLRDDINGLDEVNVILSHLDADHFRLLRWDTELLNKVACIFIPSQQHWVDCADKRVASKVTPVKTMKVVGPNLTLHCVRTQPSFKTNIKNDHALIVHVQLNDEDALFPGDYSYQKLRSDKNPYLANLPQSYEYLCAPHHGDEESQYSVPEKNSPNSVVFFSAGNHKSWGHPKPSSVTAHESQGFNTHTEQYTRCIKGLNGCTINKANKIIG